ncbi:MAG TPA: hypothetical protein VFR17_14855 [Mycobacterium sp.]|nr:hypothetical protein [Mycobacterium sp.]
MTALLRRSADGLAGASMIVALFLPWTDAHGAGWDLWRVSFPLCVTVALCALATAATGGHVGLMRPDVSIIGAADVFGVITTVTLALLLAYDFPQHPGRQPGLILALISAAVVAFASADYRPLRGAPLFSRVADGAR